ncbi:helix-turn-helix transcriptional regulator [Photobacterium sp. GSS17]|uniref:helix-turn-helix transcriptional regulator n=1 Tax=Photobacterium sp. GSS17 TaxID=3020715 RepID=UPI0023608F7B|nr:hypothetical protein [Photobacterium sp. GSS17]
MFNYACYPAVEVSYKVKTPDSVTPSQLKSEEEPDQSSKSLIEATEQSTPQLISHKEVLEMFQITSKATIYKWRQNRGFPDPVTLMPLRWLRSAIEEWKENVGGCGR